MELPQHTLACYNCPESLTLTRTEALNKSLLRRSFTIHTHLSVRISEKLYSLSEATAHVHTHLAFPLGRDVLSASEKAVQC